jgi:tRNA pseudouridine55 synthase
MIDGALLLDKAVGVTSNRALQQAKKLFGARKAGHAGTLDPLASGLLIVLFGEATKFAAPLLDSDKEYLATLKLGEKTDTGDAEGRILQSRIVPAETERDIGPVLETFKGEIDQVPPMHSALKRDGVPLYKLARRGESVERKPRRVTISLLKRISYERPVLGLRIRCSKGTYVRTLAEDIGEALGTGAHLAALRRTAAGRFSVSNAATLDGLGAVSAAERTGRVVSLRELLEGFPEVRLDAAAEARFRNGAAVEMQGLAAGICAVYGGDGAVVGLGSADGTGSLRPLRLTASQAAEK